MGADIAVIDNPTKNRFEATLHGVTAIATYAREGDCIRFTHTVVPAALEGQGIGSALVQAALAAARAQRLTVVPLCSFVAGYMQRHPETQDLLDPAAKL